MFTGNEDHKISLEVGSTMTKRYRDAVQAGTQLGGFFGKTDVLELLNQQRCVGFRYYYGLDAANAKLMVLVGTDEDENDLVNGLILEKSFPCPTSCGDANALNSDI